MLAAQDRSKDPVEDSGDVDDREAEKAALVKDMLYESRGFDDGLNASQECYSPYCTIHNPSQVPLDNAYDNEVAGP
jgi:hypothetical protein